MNTNNQRGTLGIGTVIAIAVVAGLLISGLGFYGYINGARTEGIGYETRLNAQYLDNQNELSTYVSSFYEQIGVGNLKSEKMTLFVTEAIKGKFEDKNGGKADYGRGGAFFSALVEAYPVVGQQFDIYDKIVTFIQAGREAYKNKQSKLLDQLRAYDFWRQDGMVRSWVVSSWLGFPSQVLEARIGTTVVRGAQARDQMYLIVTTSSTKRAYESGEMEPLTVPSK